MKTCDEAAAIAAIRHCGRRVVTAGVDRMTFVEPIPIGELLTCPATVNAAWRTSMEVGVRVEAEDARTGARRHTSTAYVTMVALDDDGRPTPVPGVVTETPDEERRRREAELRRANRLAERDQILANRDERSRPSAAERSPIASIIRPPTTSSPIQMIGQRLGSMTARSGSRAETSR